MAATRGRPAHEYAGLLRIRGLRRSGFDDRAGNDAGDRIRGLRRGLSGCRGNDERRRERALIEYGRHPYGARPP